MFGIALHMLAVKPARLFTTITGMASLSFVSVAQVGMLAGWVATISAIITHANVDLWITAEQTPAFDYGTPIPRQRLYQVRSIEGVNWAEAVVMEWAFWQRPDGRRVNVELIGLDKSNVGGPWSMHAGDVEQVHLPESVIVDEMFAGTLGVDAVGDEVEILGNRAVVRGLSSRVRTFTAAPFVFTSIRSAIAFDRRNREDEVTYVMARCMPGESPDEVARRIREEVPHIEVEMTCEVYLAVLGVSTLASLAGALLSVKAVLRIDPVAVFRG